MFVVCEGKKGDEQLLSARVEKVLMSPSAGLISTILKIYSSS